MLIDIAKSIILSIKLYYKQKKENKKQEMEIE